MHQRRIVITGCMGSGKSSVASALAEQLNCTWIDLDEEVTRTSGRSPAEFISRDGEARFRLVETEALRRVLENGISVIALGGGAWTIANNRNLIGEFDCYTVWLDVPFEICWQRINAAGVSRPLAPTLLDAKNLYDLRRPLYETANLRLDVSAPMEAQEIARLIKFELTE